ncbi:putative B3 domain-containing protein At2g27410 [Carica papaya]|uniref:putative B3 domain-containing protein At2g27410 n=1 Tax=Carica papaya TaxID=3649 RepID=UPI000B8C934C|nr:putative B3 domain-containing protein At2g27410 [Carica papaya]
MIGNKKPVAVTVEDPSPAVKTEFSFFENIPRKKRSSRVRKSVAVAVSFPVLDTESEKNIKMIEESGRQLEKEKNEDELKVSSRKRRFESDEGGGKRAKIRKNPKPDSSEIPTELPEPFKSRVLEMGGRDIKFVMRKTIFKSDLLRSQNRILIPAGEVKSPFLFPEEEMKLASKESIEVTLIEPCVDASFTLPLKRWHMGNMPYALIGNWFSVAQRNGESPGVGSDVQLWALRHQHSSLVMVLVPVPQQGQVTNQSSDGASSSRAHSTANQSQEH